ncbi:unnamed protein product [Boreogadus saida]
MSRSSTFLPQVHNYKLAWANKEVETFVCILGEEDVVYDVYVAAAAIDIRPTTKGAITFMMRDTCPRLLRPIGG